MFRPFGSPMAAALLILMFAAPTFAQHIVVAREVLLEPAYPNAIARAPDGGYVIAGYADYSAWATKVDEAGKVIWRHELAGSTVSPAGGGTEYRGISFLRDGTVLLCGSLDVPADPSLECAVGYHDPALRHHSNEIAIAQPVGDVSERTAR
jgi:hypothetical protein